MHRDYNTKVTEACVGYRVVRGRGSASSAQLGELMYYFSQEIVHDLTYVYSSSLSLKISLPNKTFRTGTKIAKIRDIDR